MENSFKGKALVIGLDGETERVIGPLLAQGKLPNIKRLKDRGVAGTLMSTVPPVTAPAWSTFMTGKNPGKHGVYSFMRFAYQDGRAIPYDSGKGYPVNGAVIGSKTIYEMISEAGKRVISINIPMTYPPRKVNGLMISCFFTPPGARDYTYPDTLIDDLDDYEIDVDFGDGFGQFGRLDIQSFDVRKVVPAYIDVLEKREKTALKLMREHPWDLFAVCFTETDRIHHLLWRYADPSDPAYFTDVAAGVREDCERFYRRLDEAIGRLAACAGEGVVTLVMSDHGFREMPKQWCLLNQWLRKEGYLKLSGDREAREVVRDRPSSRSLLNRFLDRILGVRAKPARPEPPRKPAAGPPSIDWEATQAWAEPLLIGTVGIRIRRPKGMPTDSESEYEELRRTLIDSLSRLCHPENGDPLVKDIRKREEVYHGEYASTAPDLILTLHPAYDFPLNMTAGINGDHLVTPIGPRLICGTHEPEGIYLFSGDPVRRLTGATRAYSLEDVAPTLLYLLGLPVPDDMDGKVPGEIFSEEYWRDNPVRRRFADSDEPTSSAGESGWQSEEDAEKIKERLRNLGYV